jgi:hypothetical protein
MPTVMLERRISLSRESVFGLGHRKRGDELQITACTWSRYCMVFSLAAAANKTKEQQRRHYIRMLHKVVDEADVILLVLDARDPAGCRSRLVEEEVRRREAEGKRLVFVLNKIDA